VLRVKSSLAAFLTWSSVAVLPLVACSGSAPPAAAPAETAEPGPSAAAPDPASSTAPVASGSTSAVAPAGPVAIVKTCALAPEIEICSQDCGSGKAAACETLGDLHVKQEDGAMPGFSLSFALHAFAKACSLGATGACDKRDAQLKELRAACQKSAEACTKLGRAIARQDGHDREADRSFARACDAGDMAACEARGELHLDWEPVKLHAAVAAQSLDRACTKGLASACCSLIKVYSDTDQEKKLDQARKRFEVANDKSTGPRLACDVFDMRREPRVKILAKADFESAKSLTKAEVLSIEEVLSRRVAYCYPEAPKSAAELEVDLVADGAAKLVSYTGADNERCVSNIVESVHLPGTTSRRARFTLSFEAARPSK
jgi:TPR repeat protein